MNGLSCRGADLITSRVTGLLTPLNPLCRFELYSFTIVYSAGSLQIIQSSIVCCVSATTESLQSSKSVSPKTIRDAIKLLSLYYAGSFLNMLCVCVCVCVCVFVYSLTILNNFLLSTANTFSK